MQSKLVFMGSLVAAALIAAACGSSSSAGNYGGGATASPATTPSAAPVASSPSAQPTAVTTGTAIDVGSTRLGQVLVDSNGRTLYLFAADTSTQSTCNSAACVQYWPPLLTNDAPQAGTGVNARPARHDQAPGRHDRGHLRRSPALLLPLRQEGW